MSNTYTQIYIHAVFAVKFLAAQIDPKWKNELQKYMTGIIQHQGHKLLAIDAMPDHVHLFFRMRPVQSLSDLMQDVKGSSSKWINANYFSPIAFQWQQGYGAFACERSSIPRIANYISNQQKHHEKKSFLQEYVALLEEHNIEFDTRYLFSELE